MSRWHASWCDSPRVIVEKDLPSCKACGAVPDLESLAAAQRNVSTFPPIPTDEPVGNFGLHWPPDVPYERHRTVPHDDEGQPGEHKQGDNQFKPFKPSPIYTRRLAPNEIRLLRLDRAATASYPLHVNVEIHDQRQCPIYETVSYTWGGEDNDNSKSRPIFVGLYWDILF
ncbi:hypothetical protein CEP54_015684 [Fusarium duplospermum]|uniref:Heterokaryon incompatibility domain-containing protein n=1 Tax=Fusarium duplospermum TaxID=1325734 RepID=A0A428NM62_9HYPO|nr:hypothetical protein CEP54_015684 [Fusarium duplospermum]